ncbi:MAG: ATP synthase subunit I [Paracoccaceae bacterium]|nr:ATP synthase subunit I [Paracoccaceae bacterium]
MRSAFDTLTTLPLPALAALGFALGLVLGAVHFLSLRRVTRMYVAGGAMLPALALQLARFGVLVAGLAVLAKLGAAPLLAGALGILAARAWVMRRARA